MNERIVIISGSAPLDPRVVDAIPDDAILLAADGGLDVALAAGLEPGGLIGDLDVAPRIGVAIDPAGNGKSKILANWRRFAPEFEEREEDFDWGDA